MLLSGLLITAAGYNSETPTATSVQTPSDQDISDAYTYFLGRLLVLRQERLDFDKGGFQWNKLIYRDPAGVAWANPNLDVAYSEAWVAVDENSCVQLETPKVANRYYTWQMLNGWARRDDSEYQSTQLPPEALRKVRALLEGQQCKRSH
jgi:hypothetical protein